MTYIIDLTLIMQTIFWLVAVYEVPITRRLIKSTYKAYHISTVRQEVHRRIEIYIEDVKFVDRVNRDSALGQIEDILKSYRIETQDMFNPENKFTELDLPREDDEPWDV